MVKQHGGGDWIRTTWKQMWRISNRSRRDSQCDSTGRIQRAMGSHSGQYLTSLERKHETRNLKPGGLKEKAGRFWLLKPWGGGGGGRGGSKDITKKKSIRIKHKQESIQCKTRRMTRAQTKGLNYRRITQCQNQ